MLRWVLSATGRAQTLFEWRGTWSELRFQNLDLAMGRRTGRGSQSQEDRKKQPIPREARDGRGGGEREGNGK